MKDYLKIRIYFKDEEPFMSEPISLLEVLHGEDIEFTNKGYTLCLPLKDFREYYCINSENYVIMRYTGLKDIDDNEIYEGDIVSESGHYYMNPDKLVYQNIQWKPSYSCWLRGEYQRLTPKNIKDYKIKVVGNIYTDDHLLNKEE